MWDTTPLTEFVTPQAYSIEQLVPGLQGLTKEETIWNCWDWVCRNIKYKSEWPDVWLLPSEAIARGYDDCEEHAFALCSLLRASGLSPDEVFVALGTYGRFGDGHAWCIILENGKYWVLEATLPAALDAANEEAAPYNAYILFNDVQTIELRTGFVLLKENAERKIRQIEDFYGVKVE
jgi:transglutaminase-like putative cysteine protease